MEVNDGKIVFVAHGDTNFTNGVFCEIEDDKIHGHLDNFIGVHCIMKAYFSGRLPKQGVRIEITYGEEDNTFDELGKIVDFAGARNVMRTLNPNDLVVVIDVTGVPTNKDLIIEKCQHTDLQDFVVEALKPLHGKYSYELYPGCSDPVANQDESDAFREVTPNVFFLGVVTTGGDYNEGAVYSTQRNVDAIVEAVIALADYFVIKREAPVPTVRAVPAYIELLRQFYCVDKDDEFDWEKHIKRWENEGVVPDRLGKDRNSNKLYFKRGGIKELKQLRRKAEDFNAIVNDSLINDINEIIDLKSAERLLYFVRLDKNDTKIMYHFFDLDDAVFY